MLTASHSEGHGHASFDVGASVPRVSGVIDPRVRGTVLVVVADSWLQAFLADVLVGKGYRVMAARNGVDGLRLARQYRPDVIVLDLVLPRKCGLEVLCELKTDAATHTIPVIVLSDQAPHTLAREARWAEAVLRKPFEFRKLLRHLERARTKVALGGQPSVGAAHICSCATTPRGSEGAP
jgi:DNA-binding response OmpR family regulator